MLRLVYYEFKKNFLIRSMIILVLCFLVVNALKIMSVSQRQSAFYNLPDDYFKVAYEKLYEEYKGEMKSEKIDKIMSLYESLKDKVADQTYSTEAEEGSLTYNSFSDYIMLKGCFVDDINYEITYEQYAKEVVTNAVNNINFFKEKGNIYEENVNYNIAHAFNKRKLTNFYNTDSFRCLLYYDFSNILIIMLALFGCSSVFIKEKECEMNLLLKTSLLGENETFIAKIIASVLFLICICILFSIEDYIGFAVSFGNMDAFGEPIYILEGFKDTLLNISLISFYGLCVISRMIGVVAIGMLFMNTSKRAKNSLQVILFNILIVIGLVVMYTICEGPSKYINPLILFFGRKLYMKQDYINIFDYPIADNLIIYVFSIIIISTVILIMKKREK